MRSSCDERSHASDWPPLSQRPRKVFDLHSLPQQPHSGIQIVILDEVSGPDSTGDLSGNRETDPDHFHDRTATRPTQWAWSTGTAPPSKALDSLSYLDLVARCEDSLVEQRPATWASLQVGRAGDHPNVNKPAIIRT
jgi:hypothetical protein